MEFHRVTGTARKIAIIASGLSLMETEFDDFKRDGFVICVNDSWRKFPNPDVVVTIDTVRFDKRFMDCPHKVVAGVPENFGTPEAESAGDRHMPIRHFDYMKRKGALKLSEDTDTLHSGESSGFAAINYAYHMRPEFLFLFGLDLYNMGSHCHHHSDRRTQAPQLINRLPSNYQTVIPQLNARGIKVLNGSPKSLVRGFDKVTPEEAIERWNNT